MVTSRRRVRLRMAQLEKETGNADTPAGKDGVPDGAVDTFSRGKHPCPTSSAHSNSAEPNLPNKKQRCTALLQRTAKKGRADMTPEELKATLKRQVEYYLSEENLCTDAFFHEKIEEAEKEGKGVGLFGPAVSKRGSSRQVLETSQCLATSHLPCQVFLLIKRTVL